MAHQSAHSLKGSQNLISDANVAMPTLAATSVAAYRYKAPFGQSFFHKRSRIVDIFQHNEYFDPDVKKISSSDFSVQ